MALDPEIQQALDEAEVTLGPRGKKHFGVAGDGIDIQEHRRRTLWERCNFMNWSPDETDPIEAFQTHESFLEGIYNRIVKGDPCVYCGAEAAETRTLDHIRPKSEGHGFEWVNKAPACERCNRRKGAMSLLEFLHSRKGPDKFYARRRADAR